MIAGTFNFDSFDSKATLWHRLRKLSGLQRVEVKRFSRRRSNPQNAYYWAVHVDLFRQWVSEEWGVECTPEQAHDILKRKILGTEWKPLKNQSSGRVDAVELPKSTAELSVSAFAEYLEKVAEFLADYCGIVVPPASEYITHEHKELSHATE